MSKASIDNKTIAIVGGCGHVGLPLGVKFALAGAKTFLLDINRESIEKVNSGSFPFMERGGDEQLSEALAKSLLATDDPKCLSSADVVVFVIGTPVDEHLNPKLSDVVKTFDQYKDFLKPDALIIMRSTLFPGTMQHLSERIAKSGMESLGLAFCPERVAEGYALDEIDSLPQIVSAFDESSFQGAFEIFSSLAPSIIKLEPLEAELSKLMANSWRYLEFAIANQFYMIAESQGVDFYKIFQAIRHDYPRAAGYKRPGFAAGPCLFKDTMQLASFFNHQFFMGHSAMLVNEGLASFVVGKAKEKAGGSLWGKNVGLLGLAFKANNDDIRESLSFKVIKGLEFEGANVLCSDPYVARPGEDRNYSIDELKRESDLLVLCTPHADYKGLEFEQDIVDVWGFFAHSKLEVFDSDAAIDSLEEVKKVANI